MNHVPCMGFKQSKLPKYDAATRDPYMDIQQFKYKLVLCDDEPLMCKLFTTMLE